MLSNEREREEYYCYSAPKYNYRINMKIYKCEDDIWELSVNDRCIAIHNDWKWVKKIFDYKIRQTEEYIRELNNIHSPSAYELNRGI